MDQPVDTIEPHVSISLQSAIFQFQLPARGLQMAAGVGTLLLQPLVKPPDRLMVSTLLCKPLHRYAQVRPDGEAVHRPAIQMRLVDDFVFLKNRLRLGALVWCESLIGFCEC